MARCPCTVVQVNSGGKKIVYDQKAAISAVLAPLDRGISEAEELLLPSTAMKRSTKQVHLISTNMLQDITPPSY